MEKVTVTTRRQDLEDLATHEEMDEFCRRHGHPVIPRDFDESQVSMIDKRVEILIRLAQRDSDLDKRNQRRLIASFEQSRRMFAAAVARQSRRAAKVTISDVEE